MKENEWSVVRQIRRNLNQVDKNQLKSLESVRSKIFSMCETESCASYICNWSRGTVDEVRGFYSRIADQFKPRTLEQTISLVHLEDRRKFYKVLYAIAVLSKTKGITSSDLFSRSYRIRIDSKFVHVQEHSGFALKNTNELISWSNLFLTRMIDSFRGFEFNWAGKNFSQQDILTFLKSELLNQFTKREWEILLLLKRNQSSRQIASSLCISPETLKKHLNNMFKKAGVHERKKLIELVNGF